MAGPAVVIGCTGFVGSHVVAALLGHGLEVRGCCRHPTRAAEDLAASWNMAGPGRLQLHQLLLPEDGTEVDPQQMRAAVRGASAVFLCAGHESQRPETVNFMVNAALAVLKAAEAERPGLPVVITSSTGSSNPPGADSAVLKNEAESWSDPVAQEAAGKFSPAAKTRMELSALEFVGRDRTGRVVDPARAAAAPRLSIICPSLILGPRLQPGPLAGNGLPWFARILRGEAMAAAVPDDSMSLISVTDLAKLHLACLLDPSAAGRYWGVVRSWHWAEILAAAAELLPSFSLPPRNFSRPSPETKFDTTRRDAVLTAAFGREFQLKGLREILVETIEYLKESGNL